MTHIVWIVLLFVAGSWVVRWKLAERRRKALADAVASLGFRPRKVERAVLKSLEHLPLFQPRGWGEREVGHVCVRDERGGATLLIDFTYSYGRLRKEIRTKKRQTVIAFQRKGQQVPLFQLRPERFVDQLFRDIDFPEDPEFSRRYFLRGTDPDALRRFFTAPVRLALLDGAAPQIEGGGEWLIFFLEAVQIAPADLAVHLAGAERLLAVISSCG